VFAQRPHDVWRKDVLGRRDLATPFATAHTSFCPAGVWRPASSIEAASPSSPAEGLAQKDGVGPRLHLCRNLLVFAGRHDDHGLADAGRARGVDRREPAHPRHADVSHHQVKWGPRSPTARSALRRCWRDDVGAERSERIGDRLEQQRIVIRDQHTCAGQHLRSEKHEARHLRRSSTVLPGHGMAAARNEWTAIGDKLEPSELKWGLAFISPL
jgi:hypothetical protein